jgi:CxxC motif-containing protein (DUF1111 family)
MKTLRWLGALAILTAGCAPTEAVRVANAPGLSDAEARLGAPIAGLNADQLEQFERGQAKFSRLFNPQTGLGPLFNDNNCRACHGGMASGGPSERDVLLVGANLNGGPSLLTHVGGPMIQAFATMGTAKVQVPVEATSVSRRISPQCWGMGLLEAVPEEDVMAQMVPNEEKLALGIRGIANWEEGKLGRFGMKAQKRDMKVFTEQAFDWELGISTPDRGTEQVSNAEVVKVKQAEISNEELMDVVNYQRYLDGPGRGPVTAAVDFGAVQFNKLGCVHCHSPSLATGPNEIGIPEGRTVPAYTDLLVHLMDETMADHMVQGQATGQMWRTSPLWGLRFRKKYMHDGRATTLHDAIQLHGGEAQKVRDRYLALSLDERRVLQAFLDSL